MTYPALSAFLLFWAAGETLAATPPPQSAGASAPARLGGPPRQPDAGRPVSVIRLQAFADGAQYRLDAAPEQISDIALQPGESLIAVAAGDTARWVIGDTASGSGPTKTVHVLVKPTLAGLATNLFITTDRRVYRLQLRSVARGGMPGIAWRYPADDLLAVRRIADVASAATVSVDTLNFHYQLSGDRPAWRPLRVFDDGRQTFVEFPPTLAAGEAPPLFILGQDGAPELVNYRVRGRYYVVDRLIERAQLRLGSKRQQVVTIARTRLDPRETRR